jgi:hypothetical protein
LIWLLSSSAIVMNSCSVPHCRFNHPPWRIKRCTVIRQIGPARQAQGDEGDTDFRL